LQGFSTTLALENNVVLLDFFTFFNDLTNYTAQYKNCLISVVSSLFSVNIMSALARGFKKEIFARRRHLSASGGFIRHLVRRSLSEVGSIGEGGQRFITNSAQIRKPAGLS
jgi:hypothetical protein